MGERQPFMGQTRDADAWAIANREYGFILTATVSRIRSEAIRKFDAISGGTYKQLRRKGRWIARRLFTEARP